MSTIAYDGITYSVMYIDPSIETAGDGSTPATALSNFPDVLVNNSMYVIRRTPETSYTSMKNTGNIGLKNILLIGMPKDKSDFFYNLMETSAIEAWGNDDAANYANVRMDSSRYPYDGDTIHANSTGQVFCETSILTFYANNCYFYRSSDGASAYNSLHFMFYFGSQVNSSITFEGCKFGYTQYDFDKKDFRVSNIDISTDTSTYPQYKCTGYVYISKARNVRIDKCIINQCTATPADNHYPNYTSRLPFRAGIYISNCKQFEFTNNSLYKLFRNYDGNIYDGTNTSRMFATIEVQNSDGRSYYDNNLINIIFSSKTSAINYLRIIEDTKNVIDVNNTIVNFYKMKDTSLVSLTLQNARAIIYFNSYTQIRLKNLTCDNTENEDELYFKGLPVLYVEYNGLGMPGNPGSYIEKVNCKFKHDANVSVTNCNIIELVSPEGQWAKDNNNYWNSGNAYINGLSWNPSKTIIATDIHVDAPLNGGYAFNLYHVGVKTDYVGGRVYLSSSSLTANKIYNHFVSNAGLNVYGNSFLKVAEYEVNQTGYAGSVHLACDTNKDTSVWVGKSNARLFYENTSSNLYAKSQCSVLVCPNYLAEGQFFARNGTYLAKSWNVTRTGSNSAASIKFYNNTVNSDDTWPLYIGMEPTSGIEIVPSTVGKKMLTCYIALKNFHETDLPKCSRKCGVAVNVPETLADGTVTEHVYTSTGKLRPDDSTWSNDTDLTTYRFEIPIEVKDVTNPIDVKLWYNWYDIDGFVYFDPDIKLTDITQE